MISRSAGSAGAIRRSGGASSETTWSRISIVDAPAKGGRPASTANSMAPSPYTSHRRSSAAVSPRACSGAMYAGVPTTASALELCERSISRASPKSITHGLQAPSASRSTRTFPGLRSRCTMPRRCAACTAFATSRTSRTRSSIAIPGAAAPRVSPSTSCMAMNDRPATSPTSNTLQTCSCSMRAWACASRRKRARRSGRSACRNVSATSRERRGSCARNTSPPPPAPRRATIR